MPYLESLRVFVRVVELGSITAGGRDLRLTPAVASNRIKELERRLDVRLFNRTTRKLTPTEVGHTLYDHARQVVQSLEDAEAAVSGFSAQPRGIVRVTAPLGVGKRIVAPLVPEFVDLYPDVSVRLRLSDRKVDLVEDGLDVAFFVGRPPDSNLKLRKIMDAPRVLCAAPAYLERRGTPRTPEDLRHHNCLLLRYPRSPEWFWTLKGPDGPLKLEVAGSYDSDDGDVLTDWALAGRGIVNKPRFDIEEHLASGALVELLSDTPPESSLLGCLYPHRRLQDAKVRLFIDYLLERCRERLASVA
ncbi:DNA-binding transcriptional regulator, LysR family [Cribrihabitans marinus]|uniref:DNA-binding transcriptional regulator, LysR family n=1 Tax=Cribrihabitans marinus TaxID=1227549 RepID=A0A1H7D757_9RHOB|nr:LysR family transcriptional regulator [Cribrihabitans marinus]GGH37923.1 LysR family transcriptional regulator [Cribrihabitans marinus]SEJ97586.1 DNA-binding transcriptional regulator, LysR family [Cribrihabitans marinus]